MLESGGRCLVVDFEPQKSVLGRVVARVILGSVMILTCWVIFGPADA